MASVQVETTKRQRTRGPKRPWTARATAPGMNDQIVELANPGIHILLFSPQLVDLEERADYARRFPDGKDLVDYVNECRMAAIGVRWPRAEYWLHFSSTMDHSVIRRASDHVRLGIEVVGGQLGVRAGDDLFRWSRRTPDDQLISLEDGFYEVTACMMPEQDGPIRIYIHLARCPARPELGYQHVPELFGEPPVL
jgi:hypothetical protein